MMFWWVLSGVVCVVWAVCETWRMVTLRTSPFWLAMLVFAFLAGIACLPIALSHTWFDKEEAQ